MEFPWKMFAMLTSVLLRTMVLEAIDVQELDSRG